MNNRLVSLGLVSLFSLSACASAGSQQSLCEAQSPSVEETEAKLEKDIDSVPETKSSVSKNDHLRVVGVLIASPESGVDEESFHPFDVLSSGTTEIAFWLEPSRPIAALAIAKSKVSLGDDTGACAGCEQRGSWGEKSAKIGIGESIAKSGKAALFRVNAVGRPSPGATQIVTKGEIVLQLAAENESKKFTLPLQNGAKIDLGDVSYEVAVSEKAEGWKHISLNSKKEVNIVRLLGAQSHGVDIESKQSFGKSTMWIENQVEFSYEFSLRTDASEVEVNLSYIPKLEFETVSFDFHFSIDDLNEGPKSKNAWGPAAF